MQIYPSKVFKNACPEYPSKYFLLDMRSKSHSGAYYQEIMNKTGLQFLDKEHIQLDDNQKIPLDLVDCNTPMLFLVENLKEFSSLMSSNQWFSIRNNPHDIAMDGSGHILTIRTVL